MSDANVDPECEAAREAMSAHLDGEPTPVAQPWLTGHLVGCEPCRAWFESATEIQRRTRLTLVPLIPDLTPRILAAAAIHGTSAERRPETRNTRLEATWRALLVVVASVQLWFSLPILLFAQDHDVTTHPAHELGSFNTALACGFLVVAWRPRAARGMRPLVGAVAALLVVTAVIDIASRHTTSSDEAPHLLVAVGYVLLLLISRSHDDPAGYQGMAPAEVPQLPVVKLQENMQFPPAQTDPAPKHGRATA
jgi:predicted anti-sigma-YlaC factor YlaD